MTSATLDPLVEGDAQLRALAFSDLETTLGWRNHGDSRIWFHSTGTVSAELHREWFDRYLERANDYMFILEVSGSAVAQASLYDVVSDSAEFGRLLVDPARRGQGLSHRVLALCLRVADEVLALSEIHLEVKRDNAPAIRAYVAAGFHPDPSRDGRNDSLAMSRLRR